MTEQIDYNSEAGRQAAADMLRRHDDFEVEANITSAIRYFLTQTGLAKSEEIVEENPPSDGSRRAVDLTALDTFIEVKRRISTTRGVVANDEYVRQIDDYLRDSEAQGRVRMGVLTDGKHWLLRWPNAGAPKNVRPYAYTLNDADRWGGLHEWLRSEALVSRENIKPDREQVENQFGAKSPRYEREIRELTTLYGRFASYETIQVKRRLWFELLRTAMGEIASSEAELDDLFVRHTYLSAVIGMALQARFGIDIRQLAENNPADLLTGHEFYSKTGLQGITESDFFTWPNEVGGASFLRALARRVARFDWKEAPADLASILYEAVIPTEERRQLGEYYTPAWLARAMVRELVSEPLGKTILDPSCGSGTFIVEAVAHVLEAAKRAGLGPKETLDKVRTSVFGVDIHPVAVHLARAAWVLAAQPAIEAAMNAGFGGPLTVPIYLGDSLQLRFRTDDMFGEHQITINAEDKDGNEIPLDFPRSLVNEAENFDALMGDVSAYIETEQDPLQALDDNQIGAAERETLRRTIASLQELHAQGRNHIWAYYTRNLVRPVALATQKVDVIIGNPPWISYRDTASILRSELERQSRELYGIWAGGNYTNRQEVAGLFFSRVIDLYLKDDGVIGMVMPHSVLQTGQHSKWRTGSWKASTGQRALSVDFAFKTPWDLEGLRPNTFFRVASAVVFARRTGTGETAKASPLRGPVHRWYGEPGSADMWREIGSLADTALMRDSPYAGYSRQGATIVPRCLFFVEETVNPAIIQAGQTITVIPRRGTQDKPPWRSLDLSSITEGTVEASHVFDVYMGETVVPYATLTPLKAVLPVKRGDSLLTSDSAGVGGMALGLLAPRMRQRWQSVSLLWEQNKSATNKLNLLGRLDYHGELSSQLEWAASLSERPLRIVYTQGGEPTAAFVTDNEVMVESRLYWVTCTDLGEVHYLLAVINSNKLATDVNQFTTANWAGNTRDLHKQLWKLPIPEFDSSNSLHKEISEAGQSAALGIARQLEGLRQDYGERLTVTIARRELREWLKASEEGTAVEEMVGRLLGGG